VIFWLLHQAKWEEGFHYMKYASAALGIMLAGLQMKRRFFSLLVRERSLNGGGGGELGN